MKLLFASLLLLCGALFAPASHATSALAADIAGQVVDADKAPIVGALVVIENLETGRTLYRYTDARGRYHADGLRADGLFRLTVVAGEHFVQFKPGTLQLGHRMLRNAVLGADADNPPDFMKSWRWNQARSLEKVGHLRVS